MSKRGAGLDTSKEITIETIEEDATKSAEVRLGKLSKISKRLMSTRHEELLDYISRTKIEIRAADPRMLMQMMWRALGKDVGGVGFRLGKMVDDPETAYDSADNLCSLIEDLVRRCEKIADEDMKLIETMAEEIHALRTEIRTRDLEICKRLEDIKREKRVPFKEFM